MNWKSTLDRYGRVAATLHWLTALLMVALLASGFRAANTLDPAAKSAILRAHAALGLTVLALTVARLLWWLVDAKPPMVASGPALFSRIAKTVHALFYVLILGMAASGTGMMVLSGVGVVLFAGAQGTLPDFGTYPPRVPHSIGAWVLLPLIVLHTGAVLYHHLIKRDGLLRRMAFS